MTIGPTIQDGFYYDFSFERPFTQDDLQQIEERMKALAKADNTVTRIVMSRDDAVTFFRDQGEAYKAEIIESIPANEELSLYSQGSFHRPLPRSACAVHRQTGRIQADEAGGRLLAR